MSQKGGNLNNFLNPENIAIIGASENEAKVGGILLRKALSSNLNIIPVNPKYNSLLNLKCYPSVLDYNGKIDLAAIAIPAEFVNNALEECGKKAIKDIIIISAGFSEMGKKEAEDLLVKTAHKYSIRFTGTNCFGICHPSKNLDLTFSSTTPPKGNIAFISQSGALWSYISDFSAGSGRKFGFSGFVSLGNMADLEFNDFIEYFNNDKETKSIVLYIERLKNGREFIKLCKKVSGKKKIYAVKAGSTKKGSQAAVSHTASIASDYEIYKAAFKQAGVVLCDSLLEAFEKASSQKLIPSSAQLKIDKDVFIITNAGGAGALLSDILSKKEFNIIDQPLDILGTALSGDYASALSSLKDRKEVKSVIVILTPQKMSEIKETAKVIASFSKQCANKKIIALFLGGLKIEEATQIFRQNKIPYFNTLEEASGFYF